MLIKILELLIEAIKLFGKLFQMRKKQSPKSGKYTSYKTGNNTIGYAGGDVSINQEVNVYNDKNASSGTRTINPSCLDDDILITIESVAIERGEDRDIAPDAEERFEKSGRKIWKSRYDLRTRAPHGRDRMSANS